MEQKLECHESSVYGRAGNGTILRPTNSLLLSRRLEIFNHLARNFVEVLASEESLKCFTIQLVEIVRFRSVLLR